MVGNTDLTDCEINSTKGITVSNILFGISHGTITVRRTCLDSTLVLYNSFEDVLKTVDVSLVIGNVSSVAYYNNDVTNGYIIHSFVDKNTFDTTLENYLNYDSVDAAYDSVSANASSLTSGTTFLGKISSSSTCKQITADQIKTYVKSGDTATLTLQRCGSTIKKYDALPGTGSATVNIPIQQCGSVFGNEYTTVYSLASYSMTNTSYYTR